MSIGSGIKETEFEEKLSDTAASVAVLMNGGKSAHQTQIRKIKDPAW